MSSIDRRIARVLRAYPRPYRAERGAEIAATLLDASETQSPRRTTGDLFDVMLQGVRLRFALTAQHRSGRVLDRAATPGIVMAAAFSMAMFILGEWLPSIERAPISLHFGPFMTAGPIAYAAWFIAAIASVAVPTRRRWFALAAIVATAVVAGGGSAFASRPPLAPMLVLFMLGAPSVIAPVTIRRRTSPLLWLLLAAGIFTALAVLEASASPYSYNARSEYYWGGLSALSTATPWIALVVVAMATVHLSYKEFERASTLLVLGMPWALIGAQLPVGHSLTTYAAGSTGKLVDTVVFFVVLAFAFGAWGWEMWGVNRSTSQVDTPAVNA